MILGIDPKVDYAFKHLFGREGTRPILIDVLESVLNRAPGHRIRDPHPHRRHHVSDPRLPIPVLHPSCLRLASPRTRPDGMGRTSGPTERQQRAKKGLEDGWQQKSHRERWLLDS
jgi:hypothetical protein